MALKQDRFYARGNSKSVDPSARLVIGSNDEHDPEYVAPGTATLERAARATRSTLKKVAFGVVTTAQSDEERTVTGIPSGSATQVEGVSGSLGVFLSEEASRSTELPAPATAAMFASFDEADSPVSNLGSPIGALTPVSDQPNRWCVGRNYQVNSTAKFPNDKGIVTRTLTLERWVFTESLPTMPNIHNLFTRHRLEWTTRSLGHYSEELVREFYTSYVATLRSKIDRRAAPAKQAPV